ncbi:cell surface glycoprotein CD200 receptor 1-A-like [Brachionichthys hirsutus]|uniref:cell surface glycoprotein CD200 receptor 1-A-like n=1 Tax=Brachionichthys hirsutus TaxID=412623 RepID=UPI00360437EE
MRETMWIYAAFISSLSGAWSQGSGLKPGVVRHSAFNLGSDANLTCSNKTRAETFYVIWNLNLTDKFCKIAFSNDGRHENSCNDGKTLRDTASAQSFLHISNFSSDDVGTYTCQSAYKGGGDRHEFKVSITVPPSISSWLERRDNKLVAVCKAERGKPAANITWSHMLNSTTVETTLPDSNGLFTVESHLKLPEGVDIEKLSCAIRHPYWPEEKILLPKLRKGYVPWLCVIIVVVVVAVFVVLIGIIFIVRKKQTLRRGQQSNNPASSKSSPSDNVEEVEPYASYVQRVNSIYNSSAELFTQHPAHASGSHLSAHT